jgi:chromodomain-helicase-DNA-binding protein 4
MHRQVTIVDEGQRCEFYSSHQTSFLTILLVVKSDRSLLFKRLNELNSIHRILMTGTPINNNIREIFNLLNYLDPEQWNDLDALERKYADLTEDLVKELHELLRPYLLRRVKADVMKDLPRKVCIY